MTVIYNICTSTENPIFLYLKHVYLLCKRFAQIMPPKDNDIRAKSLLILRYYNSCNIDVIKLATDGKAIGLLKGV